MELVFVILFHKNENQLFRLIQRLNENHSFFVVHVCKNYSKYESLTKRFQSLDNLVFCKRERATWASYGIVRAMFNGLEEALLRLGNNFSHLFFLSAQDYPLQSNREIRRFSSNNENVGFISNIPIRKTLDKEKEYLSPIKSVWTSHPENGRYKFYNIKLYRNRFIRLHYEPDPSNTFRARVFNCFKRISYKLTPSRGFYPDFEPYIGPQWIILTPEMCKYIVQSFPTDSSYHMYMKMVFCPDEIFFHTLLLNSKYKNKILNRCLHFTRWTHYNHPDVFSEDDISTLVEKSHEFLFARKFDVEIDNRILALIDQHLAKCTKLR
ncbi:MAG: beta-1,6-N-acetylglucosaminyltransferase [Verrucomicrobiota bacterium]